MLNSRPLSRSIQIGKGRELKSGFPEQGVDCARTYGFPAINLWNLNSKNNDNSEIEVSYSEDQVANGPSGSLQHVGNLPELSHTTSNYERDWIRLFEPVVGIGDEGDDESRSHLEIEKTTVSLDDLRKHAVEGELRKCCFRSVCWRICLGLLPLDTELWHSTLREQRDQFRKINACANDDPRFTNTLDHPLALERSSRWKHFFRMREIRQLIVQDVDRTFPNIHYFRNPDVQQAMINILACYTEATGFDYQQGMHEILAPICFVLQWDSIAYQRVCEQNQLSAPLQTHLAAVLDHRFLQADAFTIFLRVMATIQKWYTCEQSIPVSSISSPVDTVSSPLSSSTWISTPQLNPAIAFLNDLHNRLLKNLDQKLYCHLKALDIHPALFGLRWIRLLFGHEFELNDLLYVWDCIFAVDNSFAFVRYVYVTMLKHLSPMLLSRDYSDCLFLLMRFPSDVDITRIIQNALNLYNPTMFPLADAKDPVGAISPKSGSDISQTTLTAKTTPRRTRKSLVRRWTLFRAPNLESMAENSRSATNLNASNWANSEIGWHSEQPTPNIGNRRMIDSPLVPRGSITSLSNTSTDTKPDHIERIYRQCVQALESCSAHVDVLLCRSLDEINNARETTYLTNCSFAPAIQCERLHLIKFELRRAQQMLDAIIAEVGNNIHSPLVQRRIISGGSHGRPNKITSRLATHQSNAAASVVSDVDENSPGHSRHGPEKGLETPSCDHRGSDAVKGKHIGAPGSFVRLQVLRTKTFSLS
ncbi:TBC1 domain, member 5 [Clonorchis sinensis]|uniref:TBC1 domain, member 5 n=1 Tax=Clonorchis sinensis TaxID=79923 RepID=A0A3R7FYP6_CLOSI|nr:TBC1 domain, member 5 [Clonorchis sinensis]